MSPASGRAIMRVGWRNIGRNRWRSALIALLIMFPVATMAGGLTLMTTATPTPDARATTQMGTADFIAYSQLPDANEDLLRQLLPAGADVESFLWDDGRLVLPGRELQINRRALDLDGLARGMLTLIDGRLPATADEVAITRPLAAAADIAIGDQVELKDQGLVAVVGYVEDPSNLRARTVVQHVSVADEAASIGGYASWLVGLPPGAELPSLELFTTDPINPDPEASFSLSQRSQVGTMSGDASLALLVLGALALVEAGLIAAAAFAVGIRRRQRELGLLAAAGARRRQLAGTVLAEGLLLGMIGAVVGCVVGIAAILAISPWLDDLTGRRNQGIAINVVWLATAGGIGLLASLLASAAPAWSAARLPVLTALSGRRPASTPARRMLAVGGGLVVIAIVLTFSGTAIRYTDPDGGISTLLLVAGAVVGVFGFGASSPWLIERFEPISRRLPLASRIALRDTARARSRNAPIVTAVLASLAMTVALATYLASNDAADAASWQPWLLPDQLLIQGESAGAAGPTAASYLDSMAAAPVPRLLVADSPDGWVYAENYAVPERSLERTFVLTVGDAEMLQALGLASASDAMASGHVVMLTSEPEDVRQVTVKIWEPGGPYEEPHLARQVVLPATTVAMSIVLEGNLPGGVISTQTAEQLGLSAGPADAYIVRLTRPVTEADVARAAEAASQFPDTWAGASLGPSRPGDGIRIALMAFSLLLAMSVTGIAVALGEAESRPDQRTLLALGADPAIRRRIAAARAGALALLAGALAVPAGLLPAWGVLGGRVDPLVVPVPEVIVAVAILPLAAIVGALLLSRPIPSWSAFRDAST